MKCLCVAAMSVMMLCTASASTTDPGSASGSTYSVMGGGSRGVFGSPGLRLITEKGPEHATVVLSTRRKVKLDSGTQIVIQINNPLR
jgi:hypothetical protein